MNISTYRDGPCKTLEKITAVTNRGSDIILMSDCRLGRGIEKIRRALLLGRRTSYTLYANSTRGDRGVCIAVSRNRDIEILEEIREAVTENYILIRCRVDKTEMLIGCVYGPNTNNRGFYHELIDRIERYNLPVVIGGDWNTVLDSSQGAENIDLEDREHIPQKENGRVLREWIDRGNHCDPFRRKYPMAQTMSYKPFRSRRRVGDRWENVNFGQSRLDFFIISESLYGDVESVFYGDRLSKDFDHVEAVLRLGRRKRMKETVYISNETLERPEIAEIGVLGTLDVISNHLLVPCERLKERIGRLEMLYVEKCNIRRGIEMELVDDVEEERTRLDRIEREWTYTVRGIGKTEDWAQEELT